MPTTNNNRKIVDLKRWEFCTPIPTATGAAHAFSSCRHIRQLVFGLQSATSASIYEAAEDGWTTLASPALTGTFGAGAAVCSAPWSTGATVGAASLTATAGTTSTITTNQTITRDLRGFPVHILSGPNAGSTLTIVSNTVGTNSVITVATQASAFSASTVYRLGTPRWYMVSAGTLAAGSFRVYDWATNTYQSLTITGLPATIGTDGALVATPSWTDSGYRQFATGTATSATATTLVNSAKAWTVSQWVNYQVRIVSGTGAGQLRTITANDATSITVATWTTTPDATSVYSIEGNDDFVYYIGNNAVTLYRYSISANTWSTLSPVSARAAAPTTGMSGHWIDNVTATDWTTENAIINGRRIYSFRGGAGSLLDYYDIAANTWVNVTYSPAAETLTTGSNYAYFDDRLYVQKDATGRWFCFDLARSDLLPWGTILYPQGAAVLGNQAFPVVYIDGATRIGYMHMLLNTSTINLRQMVI
jgi:hypothetical protein